MTARSREQPYRVGLALCAFSLLAAPCAVARAFTEPRTYFESPDTGGGGGRFFTGSPAEGYGCDVCHEGPRAAALEIRGLPEQGYVPGQSYELALSWPEWSARAQRLRDMQPEVPPTMSLVAELVAESGEGSGRLELTAATDAEPQQLCRIPEGERAAQLYRVRPGREVAEAGLACDARMLGERCVVAVLACGADALHVRWTAPEAWQGPIWFSAGMVTTEQVSGSPDGDRVTLERRVLLPAASRASEHVQRVRSGCAVTAGARPGARGGGFMLPGLALGLLWLTRRVRRRR